MRSFQALKTCLTVGRRHTMGDGLETWTSNVTKSTTLEPDKAK